MILAIRIPRFALHIALRAARRSPDLIIALGPQPGDPQIIGSCSEHAEQQGIRAGLRVAEALARCPDLELVVPDPGATAHALDEITARIESLGAGVEIVAAGTWRFATDGLERLHRGIPGIVRALKAALPVGLDVRVGIAPTPFTALQAAVEAPTRTPFQVYEHEAASFLAPLGVDRLPLDARAVTELGHLGIATIGRFAELPRAAVVDRFGLDGLRAWHCAHGQDGDRIDARTPPQPIEAAFHFPEPVGALPAVQAAAQLLIAQIATAARGRGAAIRSITFRAWIGEGGSWTRTITLREASTDIDRLLTAALPSLAEVSGPVDTLVVRVDASASAGGHQLTLAEPGVVERDRRAREAIRHISRSYGDDAVLRVVQLEPWSRLPERQWALVPYDASISPDRSV